MSGRYLWSPKSAAMQLSYHTRGLSLPSRTSNSESRNKELLKRRPLMYVNFAILLNALFASPFLCPSPKFITGHLDDAQKGEKVEGDVQAFRVHFSFQPLCRSDSISHHLWLLSDCVKMGYLVLECLPDVVRSRSSIDAGRALAREPIRRKVSLTFRLGSRELAVRAVKFFAGFDVSDCNELKREGRNIEHEYNVRFATACCVLIFC